LRLGLPDPELGYRPVGYVTFDSDGVDLHRLKALIAAQLSYDLAPLTLQSLSAFPMTPTGKIAKAELRAQALAGR
jgi:long-chain acyl-CoA synthetase